MSTPQPGPPERHGAEGRRLSAGAIAALVGAALLLVFMLQNTQEVRVHLLLWYASLPLWFVIIGSALIGAVVWVGTAIVRGRRRRRAERRR